MSGAPAENEDYAKLSASEVGYNAPRSCTNCCGCVVFILAWALMIFVAVMAFKMGNLDRLSHGVDYLGNVCGSGDVNVTLPYTNGERVTDWASRKLLWYPVTYYNNKLMITEARTAGLCVSACPTKYSPVPIYSEVGGSALPLTTPYYVALFDSEVHFNRCVPNMNSFVCTISSCDAARNSSSLTVGDFYTGLESGVNALRERYWVLLACAPIAIVVSTLWLFSVRRTVKPMVVLSMALVVIALAAGGAVLFHQSKQPSEPYSQYYMGGAVAVWVVDFILVCIIVAIRKQIMIAADIVEESSKVPLAIPTMMLVPIVSTIVALAFAMFFLFTTAVIYTAGSLATVTVSLPNFDTNTTQVPSSFPTFQSHTIQLENWRPAAFAYNLFMLLWGVGFVNAVGFMVIAFCGVLWYWSALGDDKKPPAGVWWSFKTTVRYHLGTVAIGSCIIAILEWIRIMIKLLERQLERHARSTTCCKFCICCAECCLSCFNRILKFISRNAYIVTAMTSEPFLTAAMHAMSLLVRNAVSVAAVSVITEWISLFGKVLVTAIVCLIAYAMERDDPDNWVLIIVLVGLMTYLFVSIFVSVFGVSVDVLLLCFCYDLAHNDGGARPYFMPSDLQKHLSSAKARMAVKESELTQSLDK